MSENFNPVQKILFGSPGTGKSYQIQEIATKQLGISFNEETKTLDDTIKTVFHPEYTYSDFIGKLLPQTQGTTIIYKFYPGHFLRTLGRAYQNIINGTGKNCLLVIDELNRGNAAAIFGSIFQLLDRGKDYCSTYEVDISDLELVGLFNLMGYKATVSSNSVMQVEDCNFDVFCSYYLEKQLSENEDGLRILHNIKKNKIIIPHNLSIIATINTSDESIYYMDSAFKRRWDWQHVEAPSLKQDYESIPEEIRDIKLVIDDEKLDWYSCIISLNEFIKSNSQTIRGIEDKQVGWWFIRPQNQEIQIQQVKDKLMFYIWDSVFARDKKPLESLLSKAVSQEIKLTTYTDLVSYTDQILTHLSKFYGYKLW